MALRVLASAALWGTTLVYPVSAQSQEVHLPLPFEESVGFYETHMRHVVEDQFDRGGHPLREVNERVNTLRGRVAQKFGKVLHLQFMHVYAEPGPRVYEMSLIQDNLPFLYVVVPAHRNRYLHYASMQTADATARFENALTVGIVHELDHLALDATNPLPVTYSEKEKFIWGEIMAWAETCEHTIRVFVEKGMPVSEDERYIYDAWVRAGRSVESPEWMKFIRDSHQEAWRSFR